MKGVKKLKEDCAEGKDGRLQSGKVEEEQLRDEREKKKKQE